MKYAALALVLGLAACGADGPPSCPRQGKVRGRFVGRSHDRGAERAMTPLRLIFLALAIWGAVHPMYWFITWFQCKTVGRIMAMVEAWHVNAATSGLVWDLTIAAVALTVFVMAECDHPQTLCRADCHSGDLLHRRILRVAAVSVPALETRLTVSSCPKYSRRRRRPKPRAPAPDREHPMDHFLYNNGALHAEDVPLTDIAARLEHRSMSIPPPR